MSDLTRRPLATVARIAAIVVQAAFFVALVAGRFGGTYEGADWSMLPLTAVIAMDVVFFAAAWLLGDAAHERREREELLSQRNRELEVERAENARRAVLDERVRIAREVHDVVAHSARRAGRRGRSGGPADRWRSGPSRWTTASSSPSTT